MVAILVENGGVHLLWVIICLQTNWLEKGNSKGFIHNAQVALIYKVSVGTKKTDLLCFAICSPPKHSLLQL